MGAEGQHTCLLTFSKSLTVAFSGAFNFKIEVSCVCGIWDTVIVQPYSPYVTADMFLAL